MATNDAHFEPRSGMSLLRLTNRAAKIVAREGWIYFIAGAGAVKIGATARPPRERLKALSLGSPVPLKILALVPGQGREQELHDRFRHLHSHGEWFRLRGDLSEFVTEAAEVYGVLDERYGLPQALLREAMSSLLEAAKQSPQIRGYS